MVISTTPEPASTAVTADPMKFNFVACETSEPSSLIVSDVKGVTQPVA